MEIFDIVDEEGNPTGETVTRDEAHRDGIRHRTAHIWIIRRSDTGYDILMQKRSLNKDSFPGQFDTSSAGHIIAGDEPVASGIRELYEELGIEATEAELEFIGTFEIRYEKEFHGRMFKDNEKAFVYIYEKEIDADSLTLQTEEVECVEWFDLDNVCRECDAHNRKFCVPRDSLRLLKKVLDGREGKR